MCILSALPSSFHTAWLHLISFHNFSKVVHIFIQKRHLTMFFICETFYSFALLHIISSNSIL